jgi:hypothetical protein
MQIDADADPVSDLDYHFDADPDFYLMRIRIQVTKMMRTHADPDPQNWHKRYRIQYPEDRRYLEFISEMPDAHASFVEVSDHNDLVTTLQ